MKSTLLYVSIRHLFVALCLVTVATASGANPLPVLVKDINVSGADSTWYYPPHDEKFVTIGTLTYFVAKDPINGFELWKSDGTADGTLLVKDIHLNSESYLTPLYLTNVNGMLFFTADDGITGRELWKSDGTADGTVLVKDISPLGSSNPENLVNVNGMLYFNASDGHNSGFWKSDGTADGTVMVKDLWLGNVTNMNGMYFFRGTELWKSDGTTAGTVLVKDIYPGGSSNPLFLTNVNGTLFFSAGDGINGTELWMSDGTDIGTVMVKDIWPGTNSNSSYPSNFTTVNGTLFFTANNGITGCELWKSDGTADGTVMVKDISPSGNSNPAKLINVNGMLYFEAFDGINYGFWKSDGTASGTVLVAKDFEVDNLTDMNGTLFFTNYDDINGRELWTSDGTPLGTVLVKDICPGIQSSSPDLLSNANGTLFFIATNGINGFEVWKSDGAADGTVLVKDIYPGTEYSRPSNLTDVNGALFFSAIFTATQTGIFRGADLWKSDGTTDGTVLVKDFFSPYGGIPREFTNVNGTLFFTTDDGSSEEGFNVVLWKSDGTTAGTAVVKDIYAENLTNVNGTLFFTAGDGVAGPELWKSDGTAAGTVLVKGSISPPLNLVNMNGTLFFEGYDWTNGGDLWKSDGTTIGTVRVKDIFPSTMDSSLGHLTNVNGTLFFMADNGTEHELWKSDGTAGGTVMVKDFGGPSLGHLTNVNGTLFFRVNESELWKSNGTAVGTVLVKDMYPGTVGSSLGHLTNVNGTLFFTVGDGMNWTELWKSDGTPDGTVLVMDNLVGNQNSSDHFTSLNGTLYFMAAGINGTELWKSDGTAGTVQVMDIWPGTMSSSPESLTIVNGNLFFSATDPLHSTELWVLDLTPPTSAITAPSAGQTITDSPYTITGTAADNTTGVVLVEVSVDGGLTWFDATDTSENAPWATWSYLWTLPADSDYTLMARATDTAGNIQLVGTSVTVNVNATNSPDLTITKTHQRDFNQGQNGATYTIEVTNSGTTRTNGTVTVTDTLPAGLTATAISGIGWNCSLSTLTCTHNNAMAAGSSYQLTLTVDVASNAPSSVINTATVSGGGEVNISNNTASDLTIIIPKSPDLTITKKHKWNFKQGQIGATYTIQVTNSGNDLTTGAVTVTDTLPVGLSATAIGGAGWNCTLGTLTCSRTDTLAAGSPYPSLILTVNVANNAPSNVVNTATVSGGGEVNTSNDTASDPTKIISLRR